MTWWRLANRIELVCGAATSLLKNYGSLDCERGGCDDEARRPSISAVICKGDLRSHGNGPQGMQAFAAGRQAEGCGHGPSQPTKSARPPRHKMNCCSVSTDS